MKDMKNDLTLVAAASGDTGLPLSERDRAWDAGAATQRLEKWASSDGSGDPDKIDFDKFGRGFFWQDEPDQAGAKIGDFKFPFADVIGGKLTAVWRGVTSGAQRLSSAKGVDVPAIQKKMAVYYSKAKSQYSDPKITPPWESGSHAVDGEALAAIRATLADHGADGVLGDDELRAVLLAVNAASELAASSKHRYAGNGGSCEICGEAPGNEDAHYRAVTASLEEFTFRSPPRARARRGKPPCASPASRLSTTGSSGTSTPTAAPGSLSRCRSGCSTTPRTSM